ncbi:tRNA lysidine(34) synthetase TilS [Kangiella sp. HD9-110m-PIT-SAG07]|nr:tRNA lysidine(34) synthetase TilS [Kangiella sp. HD9-110m-PIT-SAG07]
MPNQEPVTAAIKQFLAQNSSSLPTSYLVALSGGADSVALLHALSAHIPKEKLRAVYIDHQLQSASSEWADSNRELCRSLGVDFDVVSVDVQSSGNLEAEARSSRYDAFLNLLQEGEHLVTGHHQDDQAETLLLQLFRGAGPKGLSAMPECIEFGCGYHARPLLQVSKDDILRYCEQHQLAFVEDPTNKDLQHRRNFLRHKVFPLLQQEWPQLKSTLARASELQAGTQKIVETVAAEDFDTCYLEEPRGLSVDRVKQLPLERQSNLLRYWLQTLDQEMPSQKVLEQVRAQMLQAEQDMQPSINFSGGSIKRFQGSLVWVSLQPKTIAVNEMPWDGIKDLKLDHHVMISQHWLQENHPELVGESLLVTTRCGGEKFRKRNAEHTTSLKNYFQEHKIPSWQRDHVLLIVLNGEVRAIYNEHL